VVSLLPKTGKPFTDRELINSCIIQPSERLVARKSMYLKRLVCLVARRIEDISGNISSQLNEQFSKCGWVCIARDESVDV
jgi:hypothetical protein